MLRNHQQQAIYECGEEIGFAVLVMVVDELLKLVAHVARTHVGRVGHYRGVLAGEVAGLGEDEVGSFGQTLIEKGVLPPQSRYARQPPRQRGLRLEPPILWAVG